LRHNAQADPLRKQQVRSEIRQWLPEHLTGPSEDGWLEAFAKLDAMLNGARAGSAPVVEV
jgi:hypothetical protein